MYKESGTVPNAENVSNDLSASEKGMLSEKVSVSEKVTTFEFVSALWKRFEVNGKILDGESLWIYGRKRGWLEEQDQLLADLPLEKRNAARVIHEFLRIEFQIPEERDWKRAEKLEDLYHCRACAKHVAQVYLRGIMKERTAKRFGLLDKISQEEMEPIFQKMENVIEKNRDRQLPL